MNAALLEKIAKAQTLAAERVVIQDLKDRGLEPHMRTVIDTVNDANNQAARNFKRNMEATADEAENEGDQDMADILRTLANRGSKYGDYDHMARVAQSLKYVMYSQGTSSLSYTQRESLEMIMTKIARIVCGDPNDRDSWHDIQGYAKLGEDHLPPPPPETP